MKLIKNIFGQGIPGAVVGVGIAVTGAMVVGTMWNNNAKQAARAEASSAFDSHVLLVKQYLSTGDNSQFLLPANSPIPPAAPNNNYQIQQIPRPLAAGSIIIQIEAAIPASRKYKILDMRLNNFVATADPSGNVFTADLVITPEINANLGRPLNAQTIKLVINRNNGIFVNASSTLTIINAICPTAATPAQQTYLTAIVNGVAQCSLPPGGTGGAGTVGVIKGKIQKCNSAGLTPPEGAIWIEDTAAGATACVF